MIPKKAVIAVVGTVGIGKSTLTKKLAGAIGYKTSFEKVEENPYLELYYEDFVKWSFYVQYYFFNDRFEQQRQMFVSDEGYVQDRSIYEDADIFAKMQYEKGFMTKKDFELYTSLFERMVLTPDFPKPDLLIYLDAPLSLVLERVASRGRKMEKKISIEYWKELHDRYVNWVETFTECPVLKIDVNKYDLINDPDSISVVVQKVEEFFANR